MTVLLDILLWLLILFFVVGGAVNLAGPAGVREDYRRWGYPSWFRFLTGALEIASALMMIAPATRPAGLALGAVIMTGAAATLIHRRELAHLPPSLFALLAIAACLSRLVQA